MASDVSHTNVPAAELEQLERLTPPEPPKTERLRPHRGRFVLVYGLLAAVVGVAAAGVAVFANRAIHPAPVWSVWKPSGGGLGAATEIANHVSGTYHLPGGDQLVDVISKAPSVSPSTGNSIPIHYVAVRGSANGKVDQIIPISSSNSVMYSLCGLGPSCSIATGKASVARGTLVRREILELALYTFKYVPSMQSVIAFMPPAPGTQPKYVVYLQKSDLSGQLKLPLADTLASKTPLPTTIAPREIQTIESVTGPRIYSFSLSQAQQGDAILVLAPLPA